MTTTSCKDKFIMVDFSTGGVVRGLNLKVRERVKVELIRITFFKFITSMVLPLLAICFQVDIPIASTSLETFEPTKNSGLLCAKSLWLV